MAFSIYLKKQNDELDIEFRTLITDCGLIIQKGEMNYNTVAHVKIIEFIKDKLLALNKIQLQTDIDFLKIPQEIIDGNTTENKTNIYEYNDESGTKIPIKINTIHGEKGETHTATLYLETYYNKKYDSERIKEQLEGNLLNEAEKGEKIMATKLAYVAKTFMFCSFFIKNK